MLGYRHSKPEGFKYFFNRKSGIKRETFAGHVKGFFDIKQFSYLCIESSVADDFERAIKEVEGLGLTMSSRAPIQGAEFRFSFEVYNEDFSEEIKLIFENRPDTVKLIDYDPEEIFSKGKLRTKGSSHSYSYRGRGVVSGEFEDVMDIYLALKKGAFTDFILCNEIVLKT